MADLVVIVPSRGRPHIVAELDKAFEETCSLATTLVVLALDEDDPTLGAYEEARRDAHRIVASWTQPTGNMVSALNGAALAHEFGAFALGFMGDDHRPKSMGWDKSYVDALRELGTGIVYGNDLLQGHRLPTQCAMTSDIVRALGFFAPPAQKHLYLDNFWRDLGKAAGCLRYLPNVTVEHRHPLAGKAAWDDGYQRVNASEVAEHDRLAYEAYQADGFAADVAKVRALREVTV